MKAILHVYRYSDGLKELLYEAQGDSIPELIAYQEKDTGAQVKLKISESKLIIERKLDTQELMLEIKPDGAKMSFKSPEGLIESDAIEVERFIQKNELVDVIYVVSQSIRILITVGGKEDVD